MAMKLRQEAPDWDDAKCRKFPISPEHDPWFHDQEEALKVCNGTDDKTICPARSDCLLFALMNKENWGVWGGMYTHDRTAMRRYGLRSQWGWHPPTESDDPESRRFLPPEEEVGEWPSDDLDLPDAA